MEAAREAVSWFRARNVLAQADREAAELLGAEEKPIDELGHADLIISFGGDGTLIRAAHISSRTGAPLLGVHFGRFGFVTQCHPEHVEQALEDFMEGKSQIQERMMLKTELLRQEKTVATLHSLNEAVVQRSATTRVLTFDVFVNERRISSYPADGVLVATPTGSTAYSLSAGGPVVDPQLQALLIVGVMPHTLSARPLLLPPDCTIDITIDSRGDAVLSCDGQSRLHMLHGDSVRITRSERVTRLVSLDSEDFLKKLSHRLQWSQGRRESV